MKAQWVPRHFTMVVSSREATVLLHILEDLLLAAEPYPLNEEEHELLSALRGELAAEKPTAA